MSLFADVFPFVKTCSYIIVLSGFICICYAKGRPSVYSVSNGSAHILEECMDGRCLVDVGYIKECSPKLTFNHFQGVSRA